MELDIKFASYLFTLLLIINVNVLNGKRLGDRDHKLIHQLDEYSNNITFGCMNTANWCPCLPANQKCQDSKKKDIYISYGLGNWFASEANLGNYSCKTTNCYIYAGNVNSNNTRHAYVGTKGSKIHDPKQLSIDFTFENVGDDFQVSNDKGDEWDLHMSFRRLNQNLYLPISYINGNFKIFTLQGKPFAQRTNNISIVVSNGLPRSNRNILFSNLSQYYPMQSFGRFTPIGMESNEDKFLSFFPHCKNVEWKGIYFIIIII